MINALRTRGILNLRARSVRLRPSEKKAVSRAFAQFAARHPEWAASLFDEYFLQGLAAPILASHIENPSASDAAALASAWSVQLWAKPETRQKNRIKLTPVASFFLKRLRIELKV